ncbi:MAG: helix-turn-helix transcriptional regulator [Phycisphaeraceae bacterium]|nr:helix-turn-helix transcriptional regulator [Phycisphaeraceae bacterium]MCW5763849.1 helix-turn-helix transcriptional regulator [Phycisphaeraceae bacterium]
MTPVTQKNQRPTSPRQASRRRAPVDRVLNPEVFKALADPTRLSLLSCLVKCGRPCSVTEIAACCSVDFSVINRHLAHLARAGLLTATKQGRTVWYAAAQPSLADLLRNMADAVDASQPCSTAVCCTTEKRP